MKMETHVNKKMLALYGLKWNPFVPDVPVEGRSMSHRASSRSVGGSGNSPVKAASRSPTALPVRQVGRLAHARRAARRAAVRQGRCVQPAPKPISPTSYREMGDLFGVELRPHNRMGGRKKSCASVGQTHIDGLPGAARAHR